MNASDRLVVGIGSSHGDDRAGWLIAERLSSVVPRETAEVRTASSPAQLLDWIDGRRWLLIFDACRGLAAVGEVRCWNWPAKELEEATWSGTHDIPLPAVLQLAERLGRLPSRVEICAVEGRIQEAMEPVSPIVLEAVEQVVAQATARLNSDGI